MYAIIEIGGKQYWVKENDLLDVEKQPVEETKEFKIEKVLLISGEDKVEIGRPYIENAYVLAEVLKHFKGKKVISYKYRRRKSSHWKKGHRQQLSRIKIKKIAA